MDTKTEIMNEIAVHRAAIAALKRRLEVVNIIPPKPEFTSIKETVYMAAPTLNELLQARYGTVGAETDFNMLHTEGYAKRLMLAAKMIAMQLHCKWYIDRDFVPDWNDAHQHKYTVYYNHAAKKFCVASWETHERMDVAFSTRQAAEICAEWLQENWKDYNYG